MSHAALLSEHGVDEQVTVNQRALVEKILARYAGENTLFRELLQNADDACASCVELHFRTVKSASVADSPKHSPDALPDLDKANLTQIIVRNDGFVFREEDWNRLKKIAEGNPNEDKIGAFGVGFYSLFAICDDPVVASGNQIMGFHWKGGGDQLYVKRAANPDGLKDTTTDGKPWSTFLMDLREPAPMPQPHDFARFLATCLGFTQRINKISMFFDGHELCQISKNTAPPRPIGIRSSLSTTSPLKILRMSSVEEKPIQLRARVIEWMNQYSPKPKQTAEHSASDAAGYSSSFASRMLAAFTSRPARAPAPAPNDPAAEIVPRRDPFATVSATLFLRIVSAHLKVSPSTHFANEMVRATKKNLPSQTVYSLIWTSKEEFDASQAPDDPAASQGAKDVRKLFAGLMSDLSVNGRVFIGFPTFQTTGCTASVAARFVSTVEREALDMQSKYVAEWNRELLWAGGVLARLCYEEEMENIGKDFRALPAGALAERRTSIESRALHLMRFFSFVQSTPLAVVGSETERAFHAASRDSITLLSSAGTKDARQIRLPNPALQGFIKSVPVVPALIADGNPTMLHALREKGILRDISLEDVLDDLQRHPLDTSQAADCFRWWITISNHPSYVPSLLNRFQEATIITIPATAHAEERVAPLKAFRTFLNAKTITPDLPLPAHTLPFEISRSFTTGDLTKHLSLSELTLDEWVRHLMSSEMTGNNARIETNLKLSPAFAEQVLNVLSRGWGGLAHAKQDEVVKVLKDLEFLPTKSGIRTPSQTYFPNVDLFEDLPVISLPSGTAPRGNLEKLLEALGVRRHVDLQIVFTRLLGQGDWSHLETLKYLVSVRSTLTFSELERLRKTAWLPKEGEAKVRKDDGGFRAVRYRAEELYEPIQAFRQLGLPLLEWSDSSKWRSTSDEAKLLYSIGLQKTPTVDHLLERAAVGDIATREAALNYYVEHWTTSGYGARFDPGKHRFAFVPARQDNEVVFKSSSEVFWNPDIVKLGVPVLLPKYQPHAHKLRVERDPPASTLVEALLARPPQSFGDGMDVFGYMSTQISKLSSKDIRQLQTARIVPFQEENGKIVHYAALGCFFSTSSSLPPGLNSLFRTLPSFGHAARPFFSALGVKDNPSPPEIAALVADDPTRIFNLCASSDVYLSVLRIIAASFVTFQRSLKDRLASSSFFLGTSRTSSGRANGKSLLDDDDDDDDEDALSTLTFKLCRPSQLVVNDDPQSFRVFETKILACPQEDSLEELAEVLGALRISRLVSEHFRPVGEAGQSKRVNELQRAITERTYLFLSERKQQYGSSELLHDAEWIQTHLEVAEVRSIEVLKTLKHQGKVDSYKTSSSAFSQEGAKGGIRLFIAADCELDYYEVAVALCKRLLKKQRPNDALLFMTILGTSLRNLKRRGFNVDRILNARQAEREAADRRLREEQGRASKEAPVVLYDQSKAEQATTGVKERDVDQLAEMYPDADRDFLRTLLAAQDEPKLLNAANQLASSAGRYPTSNSSLSSSRSQREPTDHPGRPPSYSSAAADTSGPFDGFRKRFGLGGSKGKKRDSISSTSPSLPPVPAPTPLMKGIIPDPIPAGPTSTSTRSNGTVGKVQSTPEATRANVERAIKATREGADPEIKADFNKERVPVAESSYCDTSSGANLDYVCDVASIRFYASKEVQGPARFVRENEASITQFVQVLIKPVAQVFTLNLRSLHVFYDLRGPLVAFNRNGSIFLNFRFYKEWKHDEKIFAGELAEPLLSTFHTIAHELAHNVASNGHDSEFAFYMGSICEQYFMRMAHYLSTLPSRPSR